ncbi:MAG: large conductance mechanosensitive channel [Solirubrobacteraceae bacterium]|nr:large conductance mechanosensitive channel [Solirubrobacteraceae bacterium]
MTRPAANGRGMARQFKEFLLRGNVVDLAVAVVIGAAFGTVIASLVRDLLTPLVAAVFGKHDFSTLAFAVNGSHFRYGAFINALVAFVSVAAAMFFFVVKPINLLFVRHGETQPPKRACPECLSDIPIAARRCAFCTAPQPAPDDPTPAAA